VKAPTFHFPRERGRERERERERERVVKFEMREETHFPAKLRLGFFLGFLLIAFNSIRQVESSIHEYRKETFIPQSDAFFFHGGSEGLFASKVVDQASSHENKGYKGRSFIR